jgi:hypothetical protein
LFTFLAGLVAAQEDGIENAVLCSRKLGSLWC